MTALGTNPATLILFAPFGVATTLARVHPVSQKSLALPPVNEPTVQLAEYAIVMYEFVVAMLIPWKVQRNECEAVPEAKIFVAVMLHQLLWQFMESKSRKRARSFK